MYLVPEEELF